jgi:multicomponent Na+:H+ antiporter subunit F
LISQLSAWILFPLLYGSMGLSFIRLVRGPTLADRIVAFDLIAASVAGIIVVTGINENRPVLVDVTAIWAVIAFLSVIGFAYYIERRGGI